MKRPKSFSSSARFISHRELAPEREPEGLRDLLMGVKPVSLHARQQAQRAVHYAVYYIEKDLEPFGGLHSLHVRRVPAHAGEVTEFIGFTKRWDDE